MSPALPVYRRRRRGRFPGAAARPVLLAVGLGLGATPGLAQTPAGTVPPRPAAGTGTSARNPERLPLWEAGLVGSAAAAPDYPGSDRTRVRAVPLPYAIYRGKNLRAENGGLRGRYRFTPDTELDVSFGGALPSSSQGNATREGLPDLDLLLEVGPRLTATFFRPKADASAGLALPARAVFSTDFSNFDSRGFLFAPEAFYTDRTIGSSPWRGRVAVGPVFATSKLNEYFYTVDPAFARADRPAYRARGGYMETRANLAFARDLTRSASLFVFGRISTLAGAANEDSPLVRTRTNFAVGFGVAYTFISSSETVPAED